MENKKYKFYMTAKLTAIEPTKELRKEAASVIALPDIQDRQPDLAYFTSRFVSTGTNLNYAHFLASELVQAGNTIPAKAVDVEHEEDKIIGHIYKYAFTDQEGGLVDNNDLLGKAISSLDMSSMHVEIASVVYKMRFPDLVEEIKKGEWCVSMETYYTHYDILVGSTILTLDEAKLMGLDTASDSIFGKAAKIMKAGEVVDQGKVARVLRGLCFSGVGIVKNPANKPSIIFEAASDVSDAEEVMLNLDILSEKSNINVTSTNIDVLEASANLEQPTYGVCVSYHNELLDTIIKTQDSKVIAEKWCSKYDAACPVLGDSTIPGCLRFTSGDMIFISKEECYTTAEVVETIFCKLQDLENSLKINTLLKQVEILLDK